MIVSWNINNRLKFYDNILDLRQKFASGFVYTD